MFYRCSTEKDLGVIQSDPSLKRTRRFRLPARVIQKAPPTDIEYKADQNAARNSA